MSHLTVSPLKILNLDALRSAAASFGATMEKAATFTSYTGNSNPCEYAIKLPGVRYGVGVRRDGKGTYTLHYDPFEAEWGPRPEDKHDGHKLLEKFGAGLGLLTQKYAVQTVVLKARARGYMVTEKKLADGSVRLQLICA